MNNPEIQYVKYRDIDFQKWDQCIRNSAYGIACAYSWFLDRVCDKWDALVWGDYMYIMPLVNSSKFGISYIYQPFFTQQLGIFSPFPPDSAIVNQFLVSIPAKFRLINMKLNLGNLPTASSFTLSQNMTCQLYLRKEFARIHAGYNINTRRNIQKAIQNKIDISPVYEVNDFLDFTQKNWTLKTPELKPKHFLALHKLISHAIYNHYGEIYGAWDSSNTLVAAVFFLTTNQKCIYLAASSSEQGIKQSAMFLIIDTFIRNNSGKEVILDFEGSNIPGIAGFYEGFGAIPETYYSVHQNRLPKILKIFRK